MNSQSSTAIRLFLRRSRQFKHKINNDHEPNSFLPHLTPLKEDNIVITKPDKGCGVVILNKDDYDNKLQTIIEDPTKFKPITTDTATHLLKLEDKLNRLARSIRSSIGESTFNLITISTPDFLYGLPKIHKLGIPLRPIISAKGNYNLAKFLVKVITPLTKNEYTIENATAFVKEICNFTPSQPVTMASFDIQSLFTNVPLKETTDITTLPLHSLTHMA